MMKFRILAALAAGVMLVACSDESAVEQAATPEPAVTPTPAVETPEPAERAQPKPKPAEEPGGILQVTGSLNWNISTETAKFTCQRAARRNPFRAQWFDGIGRIGLMAGGFPLEDGTNGTEIQSFRLTSLADREAKNASLTDVSLTVKEAGTDGGTIIFEVTAEGNIESGGLFRASGTCRG